MIRHFDPILRRAAAGWAATKRSDI